MSFKLTEATGGWNNVEIDKLRNKSGDSNNMLFVVEAPINLFVVPIFSPIYTIFAIITVHIIIVKLMITY